MASRPPGSDALPELLEALVAGDGEAVGAVYELFRRTLTMLLRAQPDPIPESEIDATVDRVLSRLMMPHQLKKLAGFVPRQIFGFLAAAARNATIDWHRSPRSGAGGDPDWLADSRHRADALVLDRERMEALEACRRELAPRDAEALDAAYVAGLAGAEAARALGIQPDAFRQRLARARRALRECVEARLGET